MEVDCSYVFLFSEDKTTLHNTHEWCAAGIEPQIQRMQDVPVEAFYWSSEILMRGEALHIPRVADLPPEAAAEHEEFQDQAIQSLISPIGELRTSAAALPDPDRDQHRHWSSDDRAQHLLPTVIGKVLKEKGAAIDVQNVKEADDLTAYRAVVLGSAIRAGNLMPEAVEFVKANQERLAQMPVAYFVVCATLREDTEETRREVAAYLDPLREIIEPVEERFFAGAIDRSKLSFPLRLVLKAMKAEEGDWRDWDAIRAWAADLYPAL